MELTGNQEKPYSGSPLNLLDELKLPADLVEYFKSMDWEITLPPLSNPGPALRLAWEASKERSMACIIPASRVTDTCMDAFDMSPPGAKLRCWVTGLTIHYFKDKIALWHPDLPKTVNHSCVLVIMNNVYEGEGEDYDNSDNSGIDSSSDSECL